MLWTQAPARLLSVPWTAAATATSSRMTAPASGHPRRNRPPVQHQPAVGIVEAMAAADPGCHGQRPARRRRIRCRLRWPPEVWTRNRHLILTPQEDGSTAVEAFEVDFPIGTRIGIAFGPPLPVDPMAVWAAAAVRWPVASSISGKASPHWCDGDHFFGILRAWGKRPVREIVADMAGCSGPTAGRITAAFKGTACTDLTRDQAMEVLRRARAEASPVPRRAAGQGRETPALPHGTRLIWRVHDRRPGTEGRDPGRG